MSYLFILQTPPIYNQQSKSSIIIHGLLLITRVGGQLNCKIITNNKQDACFIFDK